jgi:hypothetical protein
VYEGGTVKKKTGRGKTIRERKKARKEKEKILSPFDIRCWHNSTEPAAVLN